MKKFYYIYEITNLLNGKTYIGQHATNNINDGYFGGGKALKLAIKKHGKHNFKKEIVLFAKNQTCLNFFERCLAPFWWVNQDDNYNLVEGGGCGGAVGLETRNKISKSKLGKKQKPKTEAQKLAISIRMSGEQPKHLQWLIKNNHPRIGKRHSEESKRKMAAAKLGKKMPPRSNEHRLKISERMKNRIVSEETKRKISESKKRIIDTYV